MKNPSFAAFYLRWGDRSNWDVPDVHLEACDWLENGRTGRVGVLKAFRGFSKSTITGRYVPWKLKETPAYRFQLLSATDTDSAKMSRDSRNVIELHPWCNGMRQRGKLWKTHRFEVAGADDPRNPSVSAYGIMSNITGGRVDEFINDDVEVPKTIRTPALRESLRERLDEEIHILVPGGKILYLGTDHCIESIYKQQIEDGADLLEIPLFRHEITYRGDYHRGTRDFVYGWRIGKADELYVAIGAVKPRLMDPSEYEVHGIRLKAGYIRLKKPLKADERLTILAGNNWPKRFNRAEVEFRLKKCRTWGAFDSQYQLRATQIGEVRLNPDRLIAYKGEPEIRTVNGEITMWLNGVRIVGASTYWDCSLGKKTSDASAVSVLFTDSHGNLYWHRALGLTGEIDEQCVQLIPTIKQYQLPSCWVETNGPGGFVPAILRKHLKMKHLACAVDSRWHKTNKNLRILDAVEPPLSGGFLYVSEQVQASPAIQQMREWDPKIIEQPDDYLDSLAGGIAETPVRIGTNLPPVDIPADRPTMGHHGTYEIQTDN